MKYLSLLVCFILWFHFSFAQEKMDVLFVGNSLTYYHDMPRTVQRMIDEQHLQIKIDQSTFPGVSLSTHLMRINEGTSWRRTHDNELSPTVKKILCGHWDLIILQESPVTVLIPRSGKYNFEPALSKLDSIIKLKKSRTALYQPYALDEYPKHYCYPDAAIRMNMPDPGCQVGEKSRCCSDTFHNTTEEFEYMAKAFDTASKSINADVVRIGLAFEQCRTKYPHIPLYESKGDEHPSKEGSYLIACMFYKYITGQSLGKIKYSAQLNEGDAKNLRAVADGIHPVTYPKNLKTTGK